MNRDRLFYVVLETFFFFFFFFAGAGMPLQIPLPTATCNNDDKKMVERSDEKESGETSPHLFWTFLLVIGHKK